MNSPPLVGEGQGWGQYSELRLITNITDPTPNPSP